MSKNTEKKSHPSFVRLSLQERHKRVWEALLYSHQRIDTLLIAISGGGIYTCLETIKHYNTKGLYLQPLMKISAILLLAAVIMNFFSQWCSSKVHYNDYCISTLEFQCEEEQREPDEFKFEIQKHECKSTRFDRIEKFLSLSSIILMSSGLICIVYFFVFIF